MFDTWVFDGIHISIFAIIIIVSYLLGSVNFAIIITKKRLNEDIRNYGSGNAGMTNVLRTQGKGAAAVVFAGDFLKGTISVIFGYALAYFFLDPALMMFGGYAGFLAAFLGHIFPVFYGFKGGKGVAITAGALLPLSPIVFVLAILTFGLGVLLSKTVSFGSVLAAIGIPVFMFLVRYFSRTADVVPETIFCAVAAIIAIVKHRKNIERLLNGTESKIGQKKKIN